MLNRNKKTNDLNEGKWIGIGGKFMPGETPDECLKREVLEETGLKLESYYLHGIIHFRSDVEDEEMYLYTATIADDSVLTDCDEGTLAWIEKDRIFDLPLWEGDKYFLEKLLAGEKEIEMTLEYIEGKLIKYINHKDSYGHKRN